MAVTWLVLACVLASLCLSTSAYDALVKNDEHNLSMGDRKPNDNMLFEEKIDLGVFWFVVKDETVCFPKEEKDKDKYYITAFEAINEGDEVRYSGTAKLVSGGVGKSDVCVYFEGYRGAALKYLFRVYGYKNEDYPEGGPYFDW